MVATEIVLSPQIDGSEVERAVTALRSAEHVRITFGGSEPGIWDQDDATFSSAAQRSSLLWSAVLGNLLLVEFGSTPVDIDLPWNDNRTMSLLERSGLPYALARRLGQTEVGPSNLDDRIQLWLDPCRFPEDRMIRPFDGLLSGVDRLVRDTQPDKKLFPWVLSDPHLSYRRNRLPALSALPFPWVDDFVPKPQGEAALAARDQLVPLLRGVLKELVENADRHAFVPMDRPANRPDLVSGLERSAAFVCLTKGGRNSFDRAHVVVADSGVGIPRTIRRKLREDVRGRVSAEELIRRAMTDDWFDLDQVYAAECEGNSGLNWCREELLPYSEQAKLVVVSESDENGAVVGEVDTDGNVHAQTFDNIPVRGTIGLLSLGLPRGAWNPHSHPDAVPVAQADPRSATI